MSTKHVARHVEWVIGSRLTFLAMALVAGAFAAWYAGGYAPVVAWLAVILAALALLAALVASRIAGHRRVRLHLPARTSPWTRDLLPPGSWHNVP